MAFAFPSALYSLGPRVPNVVWNLSLSQRGALRLNNNLDMLNNQHMDPATEQVLVQAKILTTGIVWWSRAL